MHSSCLALAVTWISGLCCLLESHWSCAWINASNWLGSLLVYGASATASHCTQRGPKLQPQPSRGPKSLGSPSSYPLYTRCMSSFLVTDPKECSHYPSALCMLVSSSFHQLYDILTLFPPLRGIYIPLNHCLVLLCTLTSSRLSWSSLQTNFLLLAIKQVTFSLEETLFHGVSYLITSQLK